VLKFYTCILINDEVPLLKHILMWFMS